MPSYELNLHIDNIGSRNDIRMNVINELAKELPGEGKNKLASKYIESQTQKTDGNGKGD